MIDGGLRDLLRTFRRQLATARAVRAGNLIGLATMFIWVLIAPSAVSQGTATLMVVALGLSVWMGTAMALVALLMAVLLLGAALAACYGLLPLFPVLLAARLLWGLCWSFLRHIGIMTAVDSAHGGNLANTIGRFGAAATCKLSGSVR